MVRACMMAIAIALSGCAAKTAQVELSMKSNLATDKAFSFEPGFVELQHENDGWVRVDLAAPSGTMEKGEDGAFKAKVASAEVPAGKYTGARLSYARMVAVMPEPEVKTVARAEPETKTVSREAPAAETKTVEREKPPAPKMVRTEATATSDAVFCVAKKSGDVTLVVKENDAGEVVLKVKAPEC